MKEINEYDSGEYEDISAVREESEILTMELVMFEGTSDENRNHLSGLVKQIMETKMTLMNINCINDELETTEN